MKTFLQSLSSRTEFMLVIGIAFGWTSLVSIAIVLAGFPNRAATFNDQAVYSMLVYEIAIFLLLGLLLHCREWRFADFQVRPSWIGCIQGLALAVVAFLSYFLLATVVSAIFPDAFTTSNQAVTVSPSLSLTAIVLISVINPLFEELFVTAYVINVLHKRRGFWFAVNTSVAIRLVYHLYQGIPGILMVVPVGLLFATFYARKQSLWPLLVAHALWDFLPFYFNR